MKCPCPKCSSTNINKAGMYRIKRTNIARERFRCKDCGFCFTARTSMFRKKIPFYLKKKILKLYKTKKFYINKFDALKKQSFSTREIAKMLGVSKSFVHKVIKDEK